MSSNEFPSFPIGYVRHFFFDPLPDTVLDMIEKGWGICDGGRYDIEKYPDLYAVLISEFLPDIGPNHFIKMREK